MRAEARLTGDENWRRDGQQSGGSRVLIWSLLGLIVVLVGAIAAVVVYREGEAPAEPVDVPAHAETLDKWIRQLERGSNRNSRLEAARAIVRKGPKAVLAALDATTDVLGDGNALRISDPVVLAMADVGPELVDTLGEALSASEQDVRVAAACVLRAMRTRAGGAVEPLAAATNDENRWVRWFAADALGNIGPDAASAVDALIALVEHKDHFTRRRAIEALGKIGPAAKRATPALTKARDQDPKSRVRRAAARALQQVNLAEIAAESARAASQQVQKLIEQLQDEDEHLSVAAAKELGDLGPEEARLAVPALIQALQRRNKWLREAAAKALGTIGREANRAAPALYRATEDPEPVVRTAAKEALKKIQGAQPP